MGIFGDWAAKYYESGYSVMPLNRKIPVLDNWSDLCEKRLSQEDFDHLEQNYDNYDIGICLGPASGLVAVDFDYEGPEAQRIEAILKGYLPSTPLQKKGQKGWTWFYRYNNEPSWSVNRFERQDGGRFIDFLSSGRQTVLPPSIHPKSNNPYKWLTSDTPLSIPAIDLPTLPDSFKAKAFELASWDPQKDPYIFEQKSGRHDAVMGYAWRIIEKQNSIDEVAQLLVAYDKTAHAKAPYFEDKTYFHGKTPIEAATSVAKRFVKTITKKKAERGIAWELGKESAPQAHCYPSKETGFYIQNVNKSGAITWLPAYDEFADYIIQTKNIVTLLDGNAFIYDKKYYQHLKASWLDNIIEVETKSKVRPSHVDSFVKKIKMKSFSLKHSDPPTGFINLKNGVLDMKTQTLLPHAPDKFFQYVLDIDFDKDARCEKFMSFLNRSTNAEADLINLISEMLGYIIYGGRPIFEKAFFIIGPPGSGKSTFLDVAKALIGTQNYSSVPLHLIDRPFSIVQMYGKLANVVSEIDPSTPISSMMLKTITSGEEVTASYKGVDEFSFRPYAKLVMSCNQNPNINTKDGSVERRLAFINFPNELAEEDMDSSIREFAFRDEMSGILNFALEGARRLYANMRFTLPDSHHQLLDTYKSETDSVVQWADEYFTIRESGGETFTGKKLYALYKMDMKEDVKNLVNAVNFGRRFSRWYQEQIPKHLHAQGVRRIGSGIEYLNLVYSGIKNTYGFM